MLYFVVFLAGLALGAGPLVIWYLGHVKRLQSERRRLQDWDDRLKVDSSNLARRAEDVENWKQRTVDVLDKNRAALDDWKRRTSDDLEKERGSLEQAAAAFEQRTIGYDAIVRENNGLKQDLFNLSVQLRKTERDHAEITRCQEQLNLKVNELAERYLDENVAWISEKLTARNFATCRNRLLKVAGRCRDIGFDVLERKEEELVHDLKTRFEQRVRAEFQRQEQARIRAQIREEEKLARERDKQIQEAKREQAAIEAALKKAIKEATEEHSATVEHLRARLKEAEEKTQRAKSQAQMTKAGHVYVLSNIGSFGEGIYKIGMTRRLEPLDRVKELGDASVPFTFDVHMMISCDDAPSLENALHRELHKRRVNRVNFRKEFFRVDLESIHKMVEAHHGEVEYVADAEALQYRECLEMTDEDYEFVEETVQSAWDDEDFADADE